MGEADRKRMIAAARSLAAGAKIIIESDGIIDNGERRTPTLPVIVNASLAIEIGLKALLALYGRPAVRGHNLEELFRMLPAVAQDELLSHHRQRTDMPTSEARRRLEQEKQTFVDWRYAYELPCLETSPAFLADFALSLSDLLRRKYS